MLEMPLPLAGRLALVTGASGAIGAAVAVRLAHDGAAVIAHYGSNRGGADDVVGNIRKIGGEAESVGADLSGHAGPEHLIASIDEAFGSRFAGRLDILVNNAGTLDFGSLVDVTDESFDHVFAVNVRAMFVLAREAARRMTAAGWGRIINMGSVFGASAPTPGLSVYGGSKFAVNGFTRAWSRDLGPAGVTVNEVQPAVIQAEPAPTNGATYDAMQRFTSVGRFGTPQEIAAAVAFLASPAAGFINGASLAVDGGWSA